MDTVFSDPVGEVELEYPDPFGDAMKPSEAVLREIRDMLGAVGFEIIRLDAGAVTQSQHIRFRVYYLIVSEIAATAVSLNIGTVVYPFFAPAAPVRVDFPIVIERGIDMSWTGEGRVYLVGKPE
jgi:hypothetical protein